MAQEQLAQTVALGKSGITTSALGLGTWQWGDTSIWQYGRSHTRADVEAAYAAARAGGITFFDTAEVYGGGLSEAILGPLVSQDRNPVVVATKFAPLPGRWTARAVARALEASLARLGLPRVDLYQVHWPYSLMRLDTLINALADQLQAGKIRAIGISNYSARGMRRAHALLARRGIQLAANQVHHSLLYRKPERNGVLAACRELDVQLIAYSPLEQGVLTGKYHGGLAVTGLRRLQSRASSPSALRASAPLIAQLEAIGAAHGGKTAAQVALCWLIQQGALPIPGAKNAQQATANAGVLGWSLTDEEHERLSAFHV
jgi:aryl-alcohol dehydrogenase-like predicted oxidoreductase